MGRARGKKGEHESLGRPTSHRRQSVGKSLGIRSLLASERVHNKKMPGFALGTMVDLNQGVL